jgi:hypothetical protein
METQANGTRMVFEIGSDFTELLRMGILWIAI